MKSRNGAALLAFPMHGQQKLSTEGYRTRDGHFIEWFGRLLQGQGMVDVRSRPEPVVLRPLVHKPPTSAIARGTRAVDSYSPRIPDPRNRRRWWVQSAGSYREPTASDAATPAIVWNPFVAVSNIAPLIFDGTRPVVFDLLDDWTHHYAFDSVKEDVERAYRAAFAGATHVTANAEGTLELAHRFGRTDAVILTNGVDPERFATDSIAAGNTTVGYVGKIGNRVDLDLVLTAASELPDVDFVFAGPILDRGYKKPMEDVPNLTLLGDVHYDDMPALLRTFDIGWVPHRTGEFEVGGDVIKSYEYRAAHLPTLSTPVVGAGKRGVNHVYVLPASEHADWIRRAVENGPRVARMPGDIPKDATWRHKAGELADRLGLRI